MPAPGQAGAAAAGAADAPGAGPAPVPQPAAAHAQAASANGSGAAGHSAQATDAVDARESGASGGVRDPAGGPGVGDAGGGGGFLEHLLESSYERPTPGAGDLRHGTEGWRSLETSFWVPPCLLLEVNMCVRIFRMVIWASCGMTLRLAQPGNILLGAALPPASVLDFWAPVKPHDDGRHPGPYPRNLLSDW